MKTIVLAIALAGALLVPAAAAVDVAGECAQADATLDAVLASTWYEFCTRLARGDASAEVFPTQVTLGCTTKPNQCTYLPTYHVSLEGAPAGEWILRGSAHLRAVSGGAVGDVVSGSARAMECRASGIGAACAHSADGPQITAGNFNTYQWEGAWSLAFVDALGAEHRMATGSEVCIIAQYYPC